MKSYILKKLVLSIPIMIGMMFITFILLNVVPGDPVALMMKEHISPDVVARVRAQMHLDDPVIVRFFRFLGGALTGDFGISYKLKRPSSVTSSLLIPRMDSVSSMRPWAPLR